MPGLPWLKEFLFKVFPSVAEKAAGLQNAWCCLHVHVHHPSIPCNQRLSWHIHHHATKAREVHLDSLYAVDGLKTAYEEQYEARYPSTWLLDQRVALLKVAWSRLWDPFKWAWVHIHHPSTSFFVARGLWHQKNPQKVAVELSRKTSCMWTNQSTYHSAAWYFAEMQMM